MNKLLETIKNQQITVGQWMLGFVGILFVRFLLESFSNAPSSGIIPSDPYTLVHYGLFFLVVALGIICIVGYFTKDYITSSKFILLGLPIIWLAPILDLIFSLGKGFKMTYLLDTHRTLIFDFFTFSGRSLSHGSTYGIRVEVAIILLGIGYYIWLHKKRIFHGFLGMFLSYCLIFLIAIIPGMMYTLSHPNIQPVTQTEVLNYLEEVMLQSNIAHNTLHEGLSSVSRGRFFELGFNKLLSQILFILSCFFAGFYFRKASPKKFEAVFKNLRLERVTFYLLLLGLGMSYAYLSGGYLNSWVDILGLVCLVFGWIGAWMYAIHINDLTDIEIDKISNPDRPLVQQTLTSEDVKNIGLVWLTVALFGSWSAGFYPFFMNLVCLAISYIYSNYPLRLKRIPILSSFLISLVCLSTILAGFFFIYPDKRLAVFPIFLVLGIIIIFTLATNIRDVKDIEGDKANGINTLPVLFGRNGVKLVGLFLALGLLLAPIFLSFYLLYTVSIPTAILGYKLITKTPYREKSVFILLFIFLILLVLLFMITPWLV